MSDKELPARVLRYDGVTKDSKAGAVRCMDCGTILKPEQFDDGYCDEICARTAMMKKEQAMTEAIEKRLEELRRKLAARKGQKPYKKNCEEIEAEISRLENLLLNATENPDA